MGTATLPTTSSRFTRFFGDDWPSPQFFGGLSALDPAKDVDISPADGQFTSASSVASRTDRFRSEFRYDSFSRTLPMPVGTKSADVKASYKGGFLEVRVPILKNESSVTKVLVDRA